MSYCYVTKNVFPASEMQIVYIDGKNRLVSPDVETFECDECGYICLADEGTTAHKNGAEVYVCEDCLGNEYYLCEDCNEYYYSDEITNIDGLDYCESCRDNRFRRCSDCGEWVADEDTYWTIDDEPICGDCRDANYWVCEECGNCTTDPYFEDDDGDHEIPYCERCYERSSRQRGPIYDYSYKPTPVFNSIADEKTEEYFGMEIEVEGEPCYASEFLDYFSSDQIYLKKDGSVEGFEIVTQPMTRAYFYDKFVPYLKGGMKFLRERGFRGHNRAGIHIHVSEEAISLDKLKKLMCLLYPEQDSIYKKWLAITQRHHDRMSRWSKMNLNGYNTRANKKKFSETIKTYKENKFPGKPSLTGDRYTAINVTGRGTVEFRIFNSNLRIERIIKNAQVIFSLLDFTETDKLPTYNNYINFVVEHKEDYKEFYDFLVEKGIYQEKEAKEKLKQIIATMQTLDTEMTDYEAMMNKLRQLDPRGPRGIDDNDEVEGGQECVLPF